MLGKNIVWLASGVEFKACVRCLCLLLSPWGELGISDWELNQPCEINKCCQKSSCFFKHYLEVPRGESLRTGIGHNLGIWLSYSGLQGGTSIGLEST